MFGVQTLEYRHWGW